MGLFSNNELCVLCGGKLGIKSFVGRYDIKGGQICMSCGNKAGYIYGQTNTKSKTLEDVKKEIEEHEKIMEREWEIKERFDPNISVPGGLWIDETNKMFGIEMNCGIGLKKIEIYNYEDLLNYEYLEDGICITRGGMGASLAGGLLFGGTGAIVGSITGKKKNNINIKKMQMVLTMNSMEEPSVVVDLLTSPTNKGSFAYESNLNIVHQWLATLYIILKENNDLSLQKQTNIIDPVDQIRKYKSLLDEGIITQEEFECKKKQILGL